MAKLTIEMILKILIAILTILAEMPAEADHRPIAAAGVRLAEALNGESETSS